jgi:hypothetical protein
MGMGTPTGSRLAEQGDILLGRRVAAASLFLPGSRLTAQALGLADPGGRVQGWGFPEEAVLM